MIQDAASVKTLLSKAEEVLVLLPQNPGPDSIASALSLFLAIEKSSKQAYIACGTPLDFKEYPLRQADRITQKIGNKNLVISLKVDNRESVDKVSYNLDETNKVFNLIITPKKGAIPLSASAVSYSLAGARADVIFLVGVSGFDDLGSLYAGETALFTETPTVAINRLEPVPFAAQHLFSPQSSSIAEFMLEVIDSLGLTLDSDSATNLLAAIDAVTDKLQLPNVTATTFETVAKLLRAGAARVMLNLPNETPVTESVATPAPQTQMTEIPEEVVVGETSIATPTEIPSDWLSPKIYKAPKQNK